MNKNKILSGGGKNLSGGVKWGWWGWGRGGSGEKGGGKWGLGTPCPPLLLLLLIYPALYLLNNTWVGLKRLNLQL